MKTHTGNPYEANFTEDGKPDTKVKFCARLKCFFVITFHLPSLDALQLNWSIAQHPPDRALLKQHCQCLFSLGFV